MQLKPGTPQFFFDNSWVTHAHGVARRWYPAEIFPYPVLKPEQPAEGSCVALQGTVLPDPDGGWRLYYTDFNPNWRDAAKLFMAFSCDGLNWDKEAFGVVDWYSNQHNNIVLWPPAKNDSPSLIFDPDDRVNPYKLLLFEASEPTVKWHESWGLYGYQSRDGKRWHSLGKRLCRAGHRAALMATKPGGRFVAYTGHPDSDLHAGGRAIYRTTSPDFLVWDEPTLVLPPDLEDDPDVEFHGMPVFRRNDWYIGLLEVWHRDSDELNVHLAFSRDGVHWDRPAGRAPFIRGEWEWNRKWNTCASNGPIVLGDQMVFYFGGRWRGHGYSTAQLFGGIGYASVGVDRFCALEGGRPGRFQTPLFRWPGGELRLNADCRQSFSSHPDATDGLIRVEVSGADGCPLADYSGDAHGWLSENCYGDSHNGEGIVRWPDNRLMDSMKGRDIALTFELTNARLYTFEAHPSPAPG